jgi:hypothetical protein
MNTMQKIDKGIPIPYPKNGRFYPWKEMEVGDSFIVRTPFLKSAVCMAYTATQKYGKVFRARQTDDGQYRIWRVE